MFEKYRVKFMAELDRPVLSYTTEKLAKTAQFDISGPGIAILAVFGFF